MIAEIESAMVARISDASKEQLLGYTLKHVAGYEGEFDEKAPEVIKQFPAALVVFLGHPEPEEAPGGGYLYAPLFSVIVAAKNLRNASATRQGAGDQVGTYQMLKDVRALLADQKLGLDLYRPLKLGRCRALVNTRTQGERVSVFAQEFSCQFIGDLAASDKLDDLRTFHADWDLPPFWTSGEDPLPLAADRRDASDTVTLSDKG